MNRYILKNNVPVLEPDPIKWKKWFETADRTIKRDTIKQTIVISTVFLGIDHGFSNESPILFETVVFLKEGIDDKWTKRYSDINEAKFSHDLILERIKQEFDIEQSNFNVSLSEILNCLEIKKS